MPAALLALFPTLVPAIGALGSAIGLVTGMVGTVTSALGAVVGTLTTIIGTVGNLILGAGKLIFTVISEVVKFLAALPGQIFNFLKGVVGTISGIIGSVLGVLAKVGTVILGVVGGGIAAFAKGLQIATQSAMDFAKNANQLSATSGLSFGGAAQVQRRFGAFGFDGGAINGAVGGNAALFGMKAGVFGLPGIANDQFIEKFARRFQSLQAQGPIGQLMASGMLKTLGLNSPQFAALAAMPAGQIREQQNFSSNIYSGIGLGGGVSRQLAVDLPLALDKLGIVFEAIKEKVASVALPAIESLLGGLTRFGANNIAGIGQKIEAAGKWLFVEFPIIFSKVLVWISGVAQTVVNGLIAITGGLAARLPGILSDIAGFVAKELGALSNYLAQAGPAFLQNLADGLKGISSTISDWLDSLADGLDQFSQGQGPFSGVLNMLASTMDTVVEIFRNTAATFAAVGAIVQSASVANPVAQIAYHQATGNYFGLADPVAAYNDSLALFPSSNIQGTLGNLQFSNAPQNAAGSLRRGAASFRNFGNNLSISAMNNGTTLLNGAINGLSNASQWLGPKDAQGNLLPNKGMGFGNYLGGHLSAITGALSDNVKPFIDNAANAANGFQKGLGSETDRTATWQDMMLREAHEQTELLRQAVKDGADLPDNMARAAGYIAQGFSQSKQRAILGQF